MNGIKITEAEMHIMKILWKSDKSLTSNEILSMLPEKQWKITTLITLAGKLIDKGIIQSVKIGRSHAHQYSACITEDDYIKGQTQSFLQRIHHGSIKSLFNALFSDDNISSADIDELRKILKERGELK